jgi:hypothetical protein
MKECRAALLVAGSTAGSNSLPHRCEDVERAALLISAVGADSDGVSDLPGIGPKRGILRGTVSAAVCGSRHIAAAPQVTGAPRTLLPQQQGQTARLGGAARRLPVQAELATRPACAAALLDNACLVWRAGLLSVFSLPHLTQLTLKGCVQRRCFCAFISGLTSPLPPLVSLVMPTDQCSLGGEFGEGSHSQEQLEADSGAAVRCSLASPPCEASAVTLT